MGAHPFIESSRDGGFAGRQVSNLQDVAQEIRERRLGLMISFTQALFCYEQFGVTSGEGEPEQGRNGRGEMLDALLIEILRANPVIYEFEDFVRMRGNMDVVQWESLE